MNYPPTAKLMSGLSLPSCKRAVGATHVNIEHVISYDCSYLEIDAVCRRIETDEEFEQRKKEVEARQEQNRQRELKQLADLKSKYGQ